MNRLKEMRLEKKVGQKQLAIAAQVSAPFLYDLERGNRNAKPDTWERIAAALGCTVDDLLSVSDDDDADGCS